MGKAATIGAVTIGTITITTVTGAASVPNAFGCALRMPSAFRPFESMVMLGIMPHPPGKGPRWGAGVKGPTRCRHSRTPAHEVLYACLGLEASQSPRVDDRQEERGCRRRSPHPFIARITLAFSLLFSLPIFPHSTEFSGGAPTPFVIPLKLVAGAKFWHATTTVVESQRVKTPMIVSWTSHS